VAKVWKIVASTERMGGGPPMHEYFLAAIDEKDAAVAILRTRRQDLRGVQVDVIGEASPADIEWLNIRGGDVRCVIVVS
jgi:hypothetical protein